VQHFEALSLMDRELEKRRLPDSGIASDDQRATAPVLRVSDELQEPLAFPLPAEEHPSTLVRTIADA
jgi:hypothetical protein